MTRPPILSIAGERRGAGALAGSLARELAGASLASRRAAGFSAALLITLGLSLGIGLPVLDLTARGAAHPAPVHAPQGLATPIADAGSRSVDQPSAAEVADGLPSGGPASRTRGVARQSAAEAQGAALGVLLGSLRGAAVLVLLVACSNLVLLLLARGSARRWELAIRSALGATQRRLTARLLLEAGLLLVAGWGVGVLLVAAVSGVMRATWPEGLERWLQTVPTAGSLLLAAAVPAAFALLFAALPARAGSESGGIRLVAGNRATAGRREGEARARLTVVAIAMSLSLLVGGGLLLRGFVAPAQASTFSYPADSLALRVALPESGPEARAAALHRALSDLGAEPGLGAVAAASDGALFGLGTLEMVHAFIGSPQRPGILRPARHHAVSPGFFEALELEVISGREFVPDDAVGAPGVVLVNEEFAHRFFPGTQPLGRLIQSGGLSFGGRWYTVVGVVENVRPRGLGNAATPEPAIYFSALQVPPAQLDLVVRSPLEPEALTPRLEQLAALALPGAALLGTRTLHEALATFRGPLVWVSGLFVLLAAATVLLAASGLYAVVAFTVRRRTRELGIRIAVGATPRHVERMVLREALRLTAMGIGFGLFGAFSLARLLQFYFHGVRPLDPVVYAAAATLLTAVALLASYRPARRAGRLDPAVTLREE